MAQGMMSGSGVRLWGDATRAVENPETLHFHPSDMILATQQEQAYIYIYIYICMSGASGDSHLFGSMLRDLGIR
jgi:hypothetical protein